MNIDLIKTLRAIEKKIRLDNVPSLDELHKAYSLTIKLRSQLLGVIYDAETFGAAGNTPKLADILSEGNIGNEIVTLTINEPLPSLKELTSAVQEHWLELIHTAISKAAREQMLPQFEKAFVWIKIVTPRGTNNARLWDTSNRAVNLILNNLKGIFFEDDNLEHMAFGVVGEWGEEGVTIIRILSFA
ncbi:MAG: hypothetical protein FWC96_09465 [Oscillospiraceae bacterium]|nr:hypothetical protein [Oscillospiraceae bacterium]